MKIQDVIKTINQMQADGIIERYAIGGAVGATFYLEPVSTLDVDIFVTFKPEAGKLIVSPQPIFDYLKSQGCRMEGEHMVIAGWPVQFLPSGTKLVQEALEQAIEKGVGSVHTHVFKAEHLAAIALETGRTKDKTRLLQFIEEGALDSALFHAIIDRHGLTAAWNRFQEQFLRDAP